MIMKHTEFMREALLEAKRAGAIGEVPIGALVVLDGEIIARGHNEKELRNDPTAHAEIIVLRDASAKLGSWRLNGADLYVTLEPCPMCVGAMLQARIRRLIFGAPDPKAGAAGTLIDLTSIKGLNHKIEVIGGIMETECSAILTDFFGSLRGNPQDD